MSSRAASLPSRPRVVFARAVRLHLERRVLPYGNKTVVFD